MKPKKQIIIVLIAFALFNYVASMHASNDKNCIGHVEFLQGNNVIKFPLCGEEDIERFYSIVNGPDVVYAEATTRGETDSEFSDKSFGFVITLSGDERSAERKYWVYHETVESVEADSGQRFIDSEQRLEHFLFGLGIKNGVFRPMTAEEHEKAKMQK